MPTGRKGYYSIMIEGPNQYKLTVSAFTIEFQHMPKPEQLSWIPPRQAISGKTSTFLSIVVLIQFATFSMCLSKKT
jgi:hypothetical protein